MSDWEPVKQNIEVAQRIQEKFEFYLLALTFTLVGLAIQTATFGTHVGADVAELVGWFLLLVSGIFGLSRMEWTPVIHDLESKRYEKEESTTFFKRKALAGAPFVC